MYEVIRYAFCGPNKKEKAPKRGFSIVAPKIKISNSKTKNTETYDGDFWWQIYEELKQLYNLKDLIAPLEEKRLQGELKRKGSN